MSSDHGLDIMERGLEAGARFFFPKPLTLKDYENIWQFVYTENVEYFQGINIDEGQQGPPPPPSPPQDRRPNSLSINDNIHRHGRNSSSSSNTSHGKRRTSQDGDHDNKKQKRPYKKRERKEDQDFGKKTTAVPLKKTRVNWTTQLHEKFLHALSILKMARAVPKRIHALMKVRGLNRANIASHLQKYRLYQNKYKGTSESDYPRRRIRMRLPDETEYHDYSPRNNLSNDYQNRAHSRLRTQDNFRPPHNFNHVPLAHPPYHQEGSNDNFMAQANYGHPTAVTNPGNLGRPWMSGAPIMNQPNNVGAYQSLFGTSAPLYDNDLNIGSTTNVIPIMAEQQITQGMPGFLLNAPLDPNFGDLDFESLQNSPPSVDITPFGAMNGILTGTIGGEIPNNDNALDISRMDEICKGNKPVEEEEAEDGFSLPHDPLYLNGMNSNFTSQGESFVVNPNCVTTVGECSTGALVNPNMLQQGNQVDNSGWFNSVNDNADILFNQDSEKANEEEGDGGYVNPEFDSLWFVQDGDKIT
ncbi:Two-component response regulator arr2 [Thalictrum thalictroides]|uniref:Two-component response regulator arr2 n=1 Tax=Thalictrum thalictroides TaxID=46969 RepID=A0A7J6W2Q9_THATH|nr:Two-component response regulator arr2 [Thalictrum thalictroides]